MKLCEGNTVNHDLVITINEMIDLRIIYVIILVIFKIMWLFMPFFVKAFGLEPIKKQTKEDILHYLNGKAMNFDKKTCETETCAICLVDFESDESAKVVSLDCNSKHVFHVDCMNKWIEMEQNKCPMCRQSIKI